MIKLIFKKDNEELFWKYWELLALEKKASLLYLRLNVEYYLAYSQNIYSDKSFVYLVDNKPVAGVFLPIEKNGNEFTGSVVGGYIHAPLLADNSIEKNTFLMIDEIARDNNLAKIMFSIDPLMYGGNYNYLQRYNYLDTSILTYIIDLNISQDLLAVCRKGHRNDIKKILGDKNFEIFQIDKDNPDYSIHEEYRELHHKCAGRITRDKKTFDIQFEKLKQGNAVLFGLRYKNKNIAYSYFEHNSGKAIYSSSADDPDYDEFSYYHALVFSAMEYLKKINVRYLDLSQPSSPSAQFNYYPGEKELNIAFFKRGFGGDYKQNFRGIKYFSKDLFKKDMEKFVGEYSNFLPEGEIIKMNKKTNEKFSK